jgi:hypothetical protein
VNMLRNHDLLNYELHLNCMCAFGS